MTLAKKKDKIEFFFLLERKKKSGKTITLIKISKWPSTNTLNNSSINEMEKKGILKFLFTLTVRWQI